MKHEFLAEWRRYQQALRQRNAALRQGESDSAVFAWDSELVSSGEMVDALRSAFLSDYLSRLSSIIDKNLPFDANCTYRRGWPADISFSAALAASRGRDRSMGFTHVGPHRADLSLAVHDRRARYRVSRGQQKMLAATMVIAQTAFVAEQGTEDLILLVDDPAAELDQGNRQRLFDLLQGLPAQLFIATLEADDLPWSNQGRLFHVEQGRVS